MGIEDAQIKNFFFYFFFFSYFPCSDDIDTFERRQFALVVLRLRVLRGRSSHQARAPSDIRGNRMAASRLSCREGNRWTATESCRLRNTFCPLRPSSSIVRCGQLRHLQTRRGVCYNPWTSRDAVQYLRSSDMRPRCIRWKFSLSSLCNKYFSCEGTFVVPLNGNSVDNWNRSRKKGITVRYIKVS